VNGSVYTTEDMAEELKRVVVKNKATGKWPHGFQDSA
jgi:hypothetical protein